MSLSDNMKLFPIIGLVLWCSSSFAQESNEVRKNAEADRIEALIVESEEFWYQNTDSAIYYAGKAIELLQEYNDSVLLGWAEISMSTAYYYKGVLDSALMHGQKAMSIYEKVGDEYDISDAHNNIANVLGDMGMIESAIVHYYEGLRVFENWERSEDYSHYIYNNLATVFMDVEDYPRALEHLNRSLEMAIAFEDTGLIALSLSNMASTYLELKDLEKAEEMIDRVIEIARSFPDGKTDLAFGIGLCADLYAERKEWEESIEANYESRRLFAETVSLSDVAIADIGIAEAYTELGQADKALQITERLLSLPEVIENPVTLFDALNQHSKAAETLGLHELAYASARRAIEIDDTLRSREAMTQVRYMEMRELQRENNNLLDITSIQREMNESTQERIALQRYLIIGAIVLILVTLAFLYFLFKNDQRRKASEIELRELNRSKDQLLSIIGHDLRGPMGGLETLLEMMNRGDLSQEEIKAIAPSAIENLSQARNLLEDLLQWGVHQLNSRSVDFTTIHVKALVEDVFHSLNMLAENKGNRLVNDVPTELLVRSDRNIQSFILRNLLQNSIKFTHNGTIRVRGIDSGRVSIFVEDEGVGMPDGEVDRILRGEVFSSHGTHGETGTGLGMSLVREFTNALGGELDIRSEKDRGTSTELRFKR